MLNPIEAYVEQGEQAARAMNQRDQGRFDSCKHHVSRMLRLEAECDRQRADKAYRDAYKATRRLWL